MEMKQSDIELLKSFGLDPDLTNRDRSFMSKLVGKRVRLVGTLSAFNQSRNQPTSVAVCVQDIVVNHDDDQYIDHLWIEMGYTEKTLNFLRNNHKKEITMTGRVYDYRKRNTYTKSYSVAAIDKLQHVNAYEAERRNK